MEWAFTQKQEEESELKKAEERDAQLKAREVVVDKKRCRRWDRKRRRKEAIKQNKTKAAEDTTLETNLAIPKQPKDQSPEHEVKEK